MGRESEVLLGVTLAGRMEGKRSTFSGFGDGIWRRP